MINNVTIIKMRTNKSFIHFDRCLSIPIFFVSSTRPKCSFIFPTAVPLNINFEWIGLDFLQENRTSVACLAGRGDYTPFSIDEHTMYDVKGMIQVICRYDRIFYYGKKLGVISKKMLLDLIFYSGSLM